MRRGSAWIIMVACIACESPAVPNALSSDISLAKGGGGGSGGVTITDLGELPNAPPKSAFSEAHGLAAGATGGGVRVVGHAATTNSNNVRVTHAFLWTPNTGMTDLGVLAGYDGSWALDVSEDGKIVGCSFSQGLCDGWVKEATGPMQALPALQGAARTLAARISDNGLYIAGHALIGASAPYFHAAVRWMYNGTSWVVDSIGPGDPTSVSDAGTVVGTNGGEAMVWTKSAQWSAFTLGSNMAATAIDAAGTFLVGYRWAGGYRVPLYWRSSGGIWSAPVDLPVLHNCPEPINAEGTTPNAAAVVSGQMLIVGSSCRTDGANRGALWRPAATASGYSSPELLSGLVREAETDAVDINRHGQIAGYSSRITVPGSRRAVMWTIP